MTTSFVVTEMSGNGPAPIDALYGKTIDFEIVFPKVDSAFGDAGDPRGCLSTVFETLPATRTARSETAAIVQTEILDLLAAWDVRLQLCTGGSSSIRLHSEIDAFNLAIGCAGIPASAQAKNSDGYPLLTTFTATGCNATILDVARNRLLGNPSFEMTITTGPDELP